MITTAEGIAEALTTLVSVLGTLGVTRLKGGAARITATPEQVNELIIETQRLEAAVHQLVERLSSGQPAGGLDAIASAVNIPRPQP